MRDLCTKYFICSPVRIGGVNHIVETDESTWIKWKYNCGRRISTHWIFGGIDSVIQEYFLTLGAVILFLNVAHSRTSPAFGINNH